MQFPESWLREFCNPPLTTQQLADTLTMAGLEVEGMELAAPHCAQVVVGEILQAVPHPNADRLQVCTVDAGQGVPLQIVCGASNARVGIRVPCALVGAELPPVEAGGVPFVIRLGQLRGVESQGMLCSARELKLSEDHGGLLELPLDAPLGQDIRQCLLLDDMLFTLKLTPNLAHCLSIYGVARELSALTGSPLKTQAFATVAVTDSDLHLPVQIEAPDLCGRFTGRVVRNLNTQAATPAWIVNRLARCGQRSVSALVDISNYVMFELGRPSHIFDLDKIQGGQLQVRWGHPGETLALLNGNTVSIDSQVGVIADAHQVESLAGIMGGNATAVSDATQNVYLEAAFWWPKSVAGRSRRFHFSTDAGHRFERGVDPGSTIAHVERISGLIMEICGTPETRFGPIDDQRPNMPQAKAVQLRVSRAAKITGMPLSSHDCLNALQRLGLEVSSASDGETLTVLPPSYRFDLQIEEDLIEEVLRMVGYDHLPNTPPLAPITGKLRPENRRSAFAVRHAMAGLGYQETINFSFVDAQWEFDLQAQAAPIRLLNPIASHMDVMRSSLVGSLLQVLKFNTDRKADRVHIFEIGRVFSRNSAVESSDTTVAGFDQPLHLAGLSYGPKAGLCWSESDSGVDFYAMKADVEALLAPVQVVFVVGETPHPALHPGRAARMLVDGVDCGFIGELHPKWRQKYGLIQAPLVFEMDLQVALHRPVPVFTAVSKFQSVERDIAIVVLEKTSHAELMEALWQSDTGGLLKKATLFDVYRPQQAGGSIALHEKSLAVRLVLANSSATLTEEAIDKAVQTVVQQLVQTLQARLRD